MPYYNLVHQKELDSGEYDYIRILSDVGLGQLVNHIQRKIPSELLYQYIVHETDGFDELLQSDNAQEWWEGYRARCEREGPLVAGRLVASKFKPLVYKVVKVYNSTIWLRMYDQRKEEVSGPVMKGVLWSDIVWVV